MIRTALVGEGIPLARYAANVGMTADRLTRILNGYLPMSPSDIALAMAILDRRGTWKIEPYRWIEAATVEALRVSPEALPVNVTWPDEIGETIRTPRLY